MLWFIDKAVLLLAITVPGVQLVTGPVAVDFLPSSRKGRTFVTLAPPGSLCDGFLSPPS